MSHAGELAALGTSLGFTLGPTFFSLAGRRVGSQVVNRIRLLGAAPLLVLLHFALTGAPLPAFDATRWLWLALSGLVGLVAGDACLFRAFVLIGPRLTMLVYSLNPLIAALLARVLFGERLGPLQVLAMAVTLAGVGWVVSERQPRTGPQSAPTAPWRPDSCWRWAGGPVRRWASCSRGRAWATASPPSPPTCCACARRPSASGSSRWPSGRCGSPSAGFANSLARWARSSGA